MGTIGRINEIFSSIQGEGVYFGQKQVFLRFSGCNLSCGYCDTEFESFQEYDTDSVLRKIQSYGPDFSCVSFTGGEPLLQKDFLKESLTLVKEKGYQTYLETNGTIPAALNEVIGLVDIVAMDIKLPSSSGVSDDYWRRHYDFLNIAQAKDVFVKVVVGVNTSCGDFITMLDLLQSLDYSGALVIQPNSRDGLEELVDNVALFKKLCAEYLIPSCVIPQLHKLIGVR